MLDQKDRDILRQRLNQADDPLALLWSKPYEGLVKEKEAGAGGQRNANFH